MPDGADHRPPVPAPLLILAGAALWGSTGTAQALGPDAASPIGVGTLRILVGALGLLSVVMVRGRLGRTLEVLRSERSASAVAAVSIAAYQLTFFAGVALAGVAVGTLVGIGSAPIATGIISAAMGRRPTRRWAMGTTVTLVGATLLVLRGDADLVAPVGLLLAVGAGVSYAVYTVASKRLMDAGHRSGEVMAATWAAGAVLLLPTLIGRELGWAASASGAAMVLWLGLVTVAVAYLLYGAGLARLPAATVASLTLAEPLTATLLAVLVLGERLDASSTLGAALVAAGLVVVSARPRPAGTVSREP